jgi:hypothetical protein
MRSDGTCRQNHGKLMSQAEDLAPDFGNRAMVPAMLLMLALAVPLDPDHLLREGSFAMAKRASANEVQKSARDKMTPPARDPEVAVGEEYLMALQRGTAEAMELFIARHPDSSLAVKARDDLRLLQR